MSKKNNKQVPLSEAIKAVMGFGGEQAVTMNGVSPELPLDEIQKMAAAQHAQGVKSVAPASNPADLAGPPASGSAGMSAPASAPAPDAGNAGAAMNVVSAAKKVADADDSTADDAADEMDNDEVVDEPETDEEDENKVKKLKESLREIFKNEGVELEESFFDEIVALQEAVIADRVNSKLEKITPVLEEEFNKYANQIAIQLNESCDAYMNYVVEEFMTKNELTIENGLKNQLCENFIEGLHKLFESSYIEVPDAKLDIFAKLFEQAKELENVNESLLEENINLKNGLFNETCARIFITETADLADTQKEKLQDLMESVTFSDVEEFKTKLTAVKQHYLNEQKGSVKDNNVLTESTYGKTEETPKKQANMTDEDRLIQQTAALMKIEGKRKA